MAFQKRKPPGGNGRLSGDDVEFAGVDTSRDKPQTLKKQARDRGRTRFARATVFEEFGYQHARALDYADFVDRKPGRAPKRWWAARVRRRSHRKLTRWWRP